MSNASTIEQTVDNGRTSELELMKVAIRRLESSRNEDTQLLIQARDREIAMREEIKALKTELDAEKAKRWWEKLFQG